MEHFYNNAIRNIAKKEKVYLADVGAYESRYESLDGSHPTAEGHRTIAEAWIKSPVESGIFEAIIHEKRAARRQLMKPIL